MIINFLGEYRDRTLAGLYCAQHFAVHKYNIRESFLEGIKNIFNIDDKYLYGEYYEYDIDMFDISVPEILEMFEPIVLDRFPNYYYLLLSERFGTAEIPIIISDYNSELHDDDIINVYIGVEKSDNFICFSTTSELYEFLAVLMEEVGALPIV